MSITRPETLLTWPRIDANGSELPDSWLVNLVEVRVRRGLRSIGRATLTFVDPSYTLAEEARLKVGTRVRITDISVASSNLLHDGTVTAVEQEFTARGTHLVVTVDDKAHELTRSAVAETFQDSRIARLIADAAQRAGLTSQLDGLPDTMQPFAMRADSVLGLIDEICARYGCDWVVDDGKLLVWSAAKGTAAGAGTVALTVAENLQSLSVRQVSDAPTKVTVRGWDAKTKAAVTATASSPPARAGLKPVDGAPTFTRESSRAAVSTADDATLVADGLAARTGRVVATGSALFTPALRPGGTATIAGAGPSEGTYYVREVTHVIDQDGGRTTFVVGDRDPVLLSDPWAEPATVSSFRRSGLAVAVVDGIKDPDNLGRVSLILPVASGQSKSAWARVLQLGAGDKRGHLFMPDVGDEVLIGFEDDDVARPVVLGGLFGGRVAPHRTAVDGSGAVVSQAIQTRTGHLLEFGEGQDTAAQHILLSAAGGTQRLRLGKDAVVLEAADGIPLTLKVGSASIAFDGKGAITIDATTITLKGTQKVELAAQDVAATAKMGLKLEGLSTSLKAQGQGSVQAGGIQEIKGAMVKIN